MKPSNETRRLPGARLLKIAPFLFSERFVEAVVEPTIADLRSDVASAGSDSAARLRALWRGYAVFWMLLVVAPFESWASLSSLRAVAITLGALAVLATPLLGEGALAVVAAGAVLAMLIHVWYERHPLVAPEPDVKVMWRPPQINFSATEVAGNIGGLIFVVGTLVVVSIGVPAVLWFLLVAILAACGVAWGLAAWHTRHPGEPLTGAGMLRRL